MSHDNTTRRSALKILGAGAAVTAFGTGTVAGQPMGDDDDEDEDEEEEEEEMETKFEFNSMVGNDLTGADGAIRGVNAGGAPWVIDDAEVKLEGSTLKVEVEGLVLDPDAVPDPAGGTNPIGQFTAILSCLQPGDGDHVTQNVRTDPVPASMEGDAEIEQEIDVPEPCLAPIVFVAGAEEAGLPDDLWFAVTGQ